MTFDPGAQLDPGQISDRRGMGRGGIAIGGGGAVTLILVLAYVFLHDEVGSGEEEAAKNVEDGFGNYNKPNRTERMRRRARAGCSPDGRMNGKLYRQFLEAAQTNPSLRPVWVFLAPVSAKQRSLGRVRTSGAVGLHLRQR